MLMTCAVQKDAKQSHSTEHKKNRLHTRYYSIYGTPVCKKALLSTLQINDSRLDTAFHKYLNCDTLSDLRGQACGGWNALPLSKTDEVRAHIESFPKYVSHYTREKTNAKYLNANLSLSKLYQLYKEEAEGPVSESFYKNIFCERFNLRFKQPKKDSCLKCDLYLVERKANVGAKLEMIEEWHDAHLSLGESLQNQMKADCAAAKVDMELETLTFDMQKTLSLPKLSTSIAYYKRQLNLYNLGIHVGSTGRTRFNLWTENEASKGTQEVSSCLKLKINKITRPIKRLILWSDSCGGQNRSIKFVLMMKHLLQNHDTLKSISMRYLLSDHRFLPNDPEFGEVEKAIEKNMPLYTDDQYQKVMKECRNSNHFDVIRMSPDDFFSVQNLESLVTNRKTDILKRR